MKSDNKTNILDILRTDGGYVSGEAISTELGITRSAVWKNIAALKKDGFAISAVTNKGYRLDGESASLNEDSINALLDTDFMGRPLYLFDSVSSTFDKISEYPRTHGLTVAATDLLVPGVGEIIGCSEREENYGKLKQAMVERGMNLDDYTG